MLMDTIGMSIIFPVAPYIVQRYSDAALMVTMLTVIYASANFWLTADRSYASLMDVIPDHVSAKRHHRLYLGDDGNDDRQSRCPWLALLDRRGNFIYWHEPKQN